METIINFFVGPVNDFIWTYILMFGLIVLGFYFTYKTKFVQFRMFGHMLKLLTESTGKKNKAGKKKISSFQAFCISTASRVGTGNLTGVALAIVVGGPGAIFWMWVMALFGAASAFVESTIAQIYKVKDGSSYRGGPAYYMQQALNKRWMGILFSILLIGCFGFIWNAVQANTIAASFEKAFGINPGVMGILIAIATAFVIFGGIRRIAVVTEIIVPIMAVAYLLVTGYVIVTNFSLIPSVFKLIISSAFGVKQFAGGAIGIAIKVALDQGIRRGLFSNEAGMGSAPNAAAAAEVSHPVKQGLIQALGVFSDTIIICTATAFIIILAGVYTNTSYEGIQLTQHSLSTLVGSWGDAFIAICILLFAFSSIIGNYYYGETNVEFISEKKRYLLLYRLMVVGMVIFGALQHIAVVWSLADLLMGLMAIVNIIAIIILGDIAFNALVHYKKELKEGKNPVFYNDSIEGIGPVECWEKNGSHVPEEKEKKTVLSGFGEPGAV